MIFDLILTIGKFQAGSFDHRHPSPYIIDWEIVLIREFPWRVAKAVIKGVGDGAESWGRNNLASAKR